MATNIPTHNLVEVIDGLLAMIENPEITIDGLMEYIPAPDFPTGGIIMGGQQIRKAYHTGNGTIIIRSKVKTATLKNGKQEIIITEIPYQVNKSKLIDRIGELAKEKIIDGVTDLRDESSRKGMKIVIELRRDANVNVILNNLYKLSQMQVSYGINMIALDKGQPKVLNLKQILECYLEHQVEVITRRTEYDLAKAKARLHIVEGLLIALANIDEVVRTIKESETTEIATKALISKFILSEIQAKAILDMRLQTLTGLQVNKLQDEKVKLVELVADLEDILAHHERKMQIIVNELKEIQRKYGDKRMSELDFSSDLDVNDEDLIPVEDVIITITNKGYIKRMRVDGYRAQKRGGKGITGTKMQGDDFVERVIFTSSHDNLLFFTNLGKVYTLKAFQIPAASRISKGLPLVNILPFEEGERLATVINIQSVEQGGFLMFATKNGGIKKTELIEYKNIRSTGIRAIVLNEGDEVIEAALTDGTKDVILGSSNGKAVRFNESLVRSTKRAASGVKGIRVAEGEKAIGMCIVNSEEDEIIILTSNGYGKRTSVEDFKVKGRNGKGVKFMNLTEKNGIPVCLKTVTGEDDLMIITDKGMIVRTHLDQISTIGRDTQGVRIISLNDGQNVASIAIVPRSDDEDESEVFNNEDDGYLENHGPEISDLPDEAQELVEEE
jgi:DNA gyrase subunit A